MKFNRVAVAAVLLAGLGLAGCQSTRVALGMTKVTPDEFRVVTKAPLVVPPDYALRPPAPGEPRPQELQPESAARNALMGARAAEQRSDAEKLLASKAGGDKADPLIRYVVDDEFGSVAHKETSFADRVMFWRKDKPETQGAALSAEQRSDGEKLLASKAGGDKADPLIRYVVDDEFGSIAHKETSFADRVMFWRKNKPETQGVAVTADQAGASSPAPIDPEIEKARIAKLTGNQAIVIARAPVKEKKIKLPGL